MTLDQLDWSKITQAQARRLVPVADRREQAAARVFNESGSDGDEAVWMVAFRLWEDLKVFAICGEKPDIPH